MRGAKAELTIGEIFILRLGLIGRPSVAYKRALRSLNGEIRDLARGEDILRDGDRPPHSVVVIDGLLQRYTLAPDGARQIHSFYLPSDTPTLEAIQIRSWITTSAPWRPATSALFPPRSFSA